MGGLQAGEREADQGSQQVGRQGLQVQVGDVHLHGQHQARMDLALPILQAICTPYVPLDLHADKLLLYV